MKDYEWNKEKNNLLKEERGISFEDIIDALNNHKLIDRIKHPNTKKYPNQKIFIIKIKNYIYYVPFVQHNNIIFLKTIIPSRKVTKYYLKNVQKED